MVLFDRMPTPTAVPNGYIAVFSNFQALDDNGVPRTLTAETATLAPDNSAGYIVKNGSELMLVSRRARSPSLVIASTVAAGTQNITVTISGVAADGVTALTDDVHQFTLQGPPPPPLATHFTVAGPTVRDTVGVNVPADPGSTTISLL